jgi:hypothetical protein
MNPAYARRILAACSLSVCILSGAQLSQADTIVNAQAQAVGAPLDKMNHLVVIFEGDDEKISRVTVSTGTGKEKNVPRNPDGSFTLGIDIQPGDGTAQTDLVLNNFFTNEIGEDSIRLEAKKGGGVNLTHFFSEGGDTDNLGPNTREQESISVPDNLSPQHTTTFIISSPAEPTPEPASLTLFLVAAFTVGVLRRRNSSSR